MMFFTDSHVVTHTQFTNKIHNKRKHMPKRDEYELDEYIQGMGKF